MEVRPESWVQEYKVAFIICLRGFELSNVVLFTGDVTTPVHNFVRELLALKTLDGIHSHYFWNVKNLLAGYITHCDRVTKQIHSIRSTITNIAKEEFLYQISKTKNMHSKKQSEFLSSLEDYEDFASFRDDYIEKYEEYMQKLDNVQAIVQKFDRPDPYCSYLKEQYQYTLTWLDRFNEFAASHFGNIIYHSTPLVRSSLVENLHMKENNLKKLEAERYETLSRLRVELYDKRQDWLHYCRETFPTQEEIDELDESVRRAMRIIEDFQNSDSPSIAELKVTIDYVRTRLEILNEINVAIVKVDEESKSYTNVKEKTFEAYEAQRLRTKVCKCREKEPLEQIIKNSALRSIDDKWDIFLKEYEKILAACKAKRNAIIKTFITLFADKGNTREMHLDSLGKFYIDEYGRKIYTKRNGRELYSVNCEGELEEIEPVSKVAHDEIGRTTAAPDGAGARLYERAANSSRFRLGDYDTMERETEDCGHTERLRRDCARLLKDSYDVVQLPQVENICIDSTLDSEVVKYLWESVGPYLPKALQAVAELKPNNPIYCVAHRLIFDKYRATEDQAKRDKEESDKYREKILQDRIEAKIRACKEWKSLQMKAPAPKDVEESHGYALHCAMMQQYMQFASLE